MKRRFVALVAAVALSLQSCAHSPATPEVTATQPLAMEEFMVPSDPGVHVYVRNKYPRGVSQFAPAKVVLYVHGATYPFETAFDLPLEGRGPGAPRSWGNTPPSTTTKVNKLVLYAPQWLRSTPSLVGGGGAAAIPAYRTVTKAAARDRWLTGVAADKRASLIPPGWYEAWEEVTFATDQKGSAPGSLRAPNGVVQDGAEFWSALRPCADSRAHVPGPRRMGRGPPPSYMAQQYFGELTNVRYKAFLEIGEGTHSVMMEKNRMQLFRGVQAFLDDQLKP